MQGCRPLSCPGASCHPSPESVIRQRKHAEHLGCDETVIPCLQLLAGKALRHARPGLGVFPWQWHREMRGGLSSRCPLAGPAERPRPEVLDERLRWLSHLGMADPHASRFLVWDGRVDGVCVLPFSCSVSSRMFCERLRCDSALGAMKSLHSFAENLLRKSGTVLLKRAACCFASINNANVAHTQSVCGWVWSSWLFRRFIKLCSCSYSCFDFRSFQCRLFTNWTRKRTIID